MSASRQKRESSKRADVFRFAPDIVPFQIRTFWIGLLYLAISIPLRMVFIGIPVLGWWLLWSLIRIIKGSYRSTSASRSLIPGPGCSDNPADGVLWVKTGKAR